MQSGALSDLLILDLSRILAGPYCSMVLGDLGATVVKVERPGTGDGSRQWGPPWAGEESAYFISVNRNKQSLALDLEQEEGREIIRSLASKADVLIENFKVGTMEGWGLGYAQLKDVNSALIYCSITGYGQTGPYRERPGYDFMIQAQGGVMSITGPAQGPPYKVGVAIVDISAGMYAATAILAALHERARSGLGQHIDIALLDSQIAWLANVASNYLVTGEPPGRFGNAHPNIVPYETFEASDGWFALAVGNDRQFRRLCAVIGRPDLGEDPRFETNARRVQHRDILVPMLGETFRLRPIADWLARLLGAGIPCAPINSIDRVLTDPQAIHREMVVEVEHPEVGSLKLTGSPLKLGRTPPEYRLPPPALGQHSETILRRLLSYDEGKIRSLRAKGVIA
jgi:formyl-CoA transferase